MRMRSGIVAALALTLLVPAVASASGSWAVPRFTPTWAELERDLRALGMKSRPKPRPIARPKPVETAANPPSGTGAPPLGTQGTSPTETAAQGNATQTSSSNPPPGGEQPGNI